jgi:ATP-dependent 26S proteasome regulatory subunit
MKPHFTYAASYFFGRNPIRLYPGKNLTFIRNEVVVAESLAAEVCAVQKRSTGVHREHGGRYLSAKAINKALAMVKSSFIINHLVVLELAEARVTLEVKGATPAVALPSKDSTKWKRQWCLGENCKIALSMRPPLSWQLVDHRDAVAVKKLSVRVLLKGNQKVKIAENELRDALRKMIQEGVTINQVLNLTLQNHHLTCTTSGFEYLEKQELAPTYGVVGLLAPEGEIELHNASSNLMAITAKSPTKDPVLRLKELGFGGLSAEARRIIRKLVSERSSPLKEQMARLGMKPTKGVLFYGPPGTGKTFLARNLGTLLGCGENHVMLISGTDVYHKLVGESERNVRELFAPAIAASKNFKDDSEVFVLVIDEIDAILSNRTSNQNWSNSVVTTFLAQMDGLVQFNNILIVGMTNRREQLDSAVLRSGRFDEQLEIAAPDAVARKEILEIHTDTMARQGLLDMGVDFDLLASKMSNFTGADICNMVKKAFGYSIERLQELHYRDMPIEDCRERMITMKDFMRAIAEMMGGNPNKSCASIQNMYI